MVSAICPNCKILLVEAASTSVADLSSAEQYATTQADYVSNSWSSDEGTETYDSDYQRLRSDRGRDRRPRLQLHRAVARHTSKRRRRRRNELDVDQPAHGNRMVARRERLQQDLRQAQLPKRFEHWVLDARAGRRLGRCRSPDGGGGLRHVRAARMARLWGTSVATPIVASLFALAGYASANPAGNLYSHTSSLNDISSGSNGTCGAPLCVAGQGWDGPTGTRQPEWRRGVLEDNSCRHR